MNNVLLWLGGLLVALFCALFAVPHFIDWTRYRGVFEEEASRVLGREVRVAGAVNLRLLPTPYVRFEKVRLSDAAGQTGEPFFRADDFTLWLAPGPLLRGAIEAREIELRKPTLKLRLNADGGGNWQTLSIVKGSLPFVPSDVALQSVLITDGTVSIDGPDGRELMRAGAVTGELSVTALEGPFRFKGAVDWAGARHELKLSTTAFEADGGLKMKAQVTVPSTSSSYVFDGRIADLSGKVNVAGQITGQLTFVPSMLARLPTDAMATDAGARRVPIDLRAAVTADTSGANLTDIGLAFESDGKPQLVAGAAQVGWRDGLAVQSEFSARWLDLDQLMADKVATKPLDAVRRMALALPYLLPANGRGQASVSIDQITLGAEALADIKLKVERDASALRLNDFRVNLPGGTRAVLNGAMPSGDAFDGDISLRGANLTRLITWLGYATPVADARAEGAFSLKSKFAFDQQSIAVKDAFASLGNAVLTGGVSYKWVDRPRLDIVLDGDQIDLGLVSPRALDLMAHARNLTGSDVAPVTGKPGASPVAVATPVRYAFDPRTQDATLRIRAGRLLDAERDLRDVDVDAAILNGRLTLKRMRLLSGTGLELDAEGDITDIATRPRGNLRGTIGAADDAAVAELLELFDQPQDGAAFKRLRPLVPVRSAWTAKFGGDGKEAAGATGPVPAEVWLDGAILGRRFAGVARFDGGLRDWRQSNLQLNASIERPDWQRLRIFIGADPAMPAAKAAAMVNSSARGRLQLKVSGRPDQALSTFLKLEDDTFDAGLAGRVTLGGDWILAAEGDLQLRASDAAQALAVLGLPARNLPGIAIDGVAELLFKDDVLKITPSALEVAGAVVGGDVTVANVKDKDRKRIEGRLTASHASIPRLVDLLVDRAGAASAPATDQGKPQVWQSSTFDFSMLERIEGRLRLEVADLSLSPEVGLNRGQIDVEFQPGKVDITALDGDVLGSRLSSRWTLDKAPAGANLNGSVKLTGARLDLLAGKKAALAGTASVAASVTGRGLTPRGLLGALIGKGEIETTGGRVGAMAPLLLRRLAGEVVNGKREPTIEAVEQGVAAMLANATPEGGLALGNRKIAFEVADGAAKVRSFTVDTPDGRANNRTTLDLSTLMVDSEWKIELPAEPPAQLLPASATTKPSAPLPPVVIAFIGSAANLGRLDPIVSVDALVRELAVRRMERDVEELERLRRLDQERARADVDRRKAEEAARAAAVAAAAAAAIVSPMMPGVAVPAQPMPLTATPPLAPADNAVVPPVGASIELPAAEPLGGPGADAASASDAKRKGASGLTSEPRQVPSSQQLKKSRVQDVFRKMESGGN